MFVAEINEWCKKWGLKINIDKTKNMNFGTHLQVNGIENRKLKNLTEIKLLGINKDNKITFGNHVDKQTRVYP